MSLWIFLTVRAWIKSGSIKFWGLPGQGFLWNCSQASLREWHLLKKHFSGSVRLCSAMPISASSFHLLCWVNNNPKVGPSALHEVSLWTLWSLIYHSLFASFHFLDLCPLTVQMMGIRNAHIPKIAQFNLNVLQTIDFMVMHGNVAHVSSLEFKEAINPRNHLYLHKLMTHNWFITLLWWPENVLIPPLMEILSFFMVL